ncbi:MAG: hypothetical protein ACFB12_00540 [Leptolyngbyaceae cyanobacterium]
MHMMKKSLSWLLVGAFASIGAVVMSPAAIAQSADADLFGTDDDGADQFGDSASPYELIHRAILAPTMSSEEFQEQQNRAITTEAQDFRQRQQEALRQQPALTVEEPGDTISVDGEEL